MPKNKGYVYMLVSADEFEIPLMIADSLNELAQMSKISEKTLATARAKNSKIRTKYFIRRINADKRTAAIHAKNKKLQKAKRLKNIKKDKDA
jgi:hypothetical protein